MTTEYRQFLPGKDAIDDKALDRVQSEVIGNIVEMVSDDPTNAGTLADEVVCWVEHEEAFRSGCSGPESGVWVCGSIDRDPTAWYMNHKFDRSEYEISAGHEATDHEPTDMNAEEYEQHLARKAARNGVR